MSKEKSEYRLGGLSFLGLLTLMFVYLKLTSVITWSWVWILSPLWIPLIISLIVIFVIIIGVLIAEMFKSIKK